MPLLYKPWVIMECYAKNDQHRMNNKELMTNVDMFQFIEKGMRGGVRYIAN